MTKTKTPATEAETIPAPAAPDATDANTLQGALDQVAKKKLAELEAAGLVPTAEALAAAAEAKAEIEAVEAEVAAQLAEKAADLAAIEAAEAEAAVQAAAGARAAADAAAMEVAATEAAVAEAEASTLDLSKLTYLAKQVDMLNFTGLRQGLVDELRDLHQAQITEDEGWTVEIEGVTGSRSDTLENALTNWANAARRAVMKATA